MNSRQVCTLLLSGLAFAPSADARDVSLTASAPLTLCGAVRVLAGSATVYHASARNGDLEVRVARGFLSVQSEVWPGVEKRDSTRTIPMDGGKAHLMRGSFATVDVLPGFRLEAPPEPDCGTFELGPNPLQVFGVASPRTVDRWRHFPAVAEERFVLVPSGTLRLEGPFVLSVEQGNLSFSTEGRQGMVWAGATLEAGLKASVVPPASVETTLPTERRTISLVVEQGSMVVHQGHADRPRKYWDGEARLSDPLNLMPGKYFPRTRLTEFDALQAHWAAPRTVIGSDDLTLAADQVWLRDIGGRTLTLHEPRLVPRSVSPDRRTLGFDSDFSPIPQFAGQAIGGGTGLLVSALAVLGVVILGLWGWPSAQKRRLLPLWALLTRLRASQVHSNTTRAAILALVRAQPGLGKRELAALAGRGWGTILYHVHVLEVHGAILSVRAGRHTRLYARSPTTAKNAPVDALRRIGPVGRLLDFVGAHPGCNQTEVSRHLGLKPATVWWHVRRLEAVGALRRERFGPFVRYFAATSGEPSHDAFRATSVPSGAPRES